MTNRLPERKIGLVALLIFALAISIHAQYWQQHVRYVMDIDFDHEKHRYSGTQKLHYTNNSPDTLRKAFYHLYFNAFQPNSMMDVRSRTIADPDMRIGARISELSPSEIGYQKIRKFTMDGTPVSFSIEETILVAQLPEPVSPGQTVVFDMAFESQVPLQIRRSGRFNAEGIDYSMAQWYPKICSYDTDGWHPTPYVGREFYGEIGDFDVTIRIDPSYVVAANGYLQPDSNTEDKGYSGAKPWETAQQEISAGKKSWRFVAPDVHDFVWAADPDYKHIKRTTSQGIDLHFYFVETPENEDAWRKAQPVTEFVLERANAMFGMYPYKQYSIIQGGDGGMEYPMATLITGNRSLRSLVGVIVHEILHSWYHGIIATNESLYAWMDEGFVTYTEYLILQEIAHEGLIPGLQPEGRPMESDFQRYRQFAITGNEEPLTTHADYFETNTAYAIAAYSKGGIFLCQLEYVIGKANFQKTMQAYYNAWKFKHPTPHDFIRVAERTSGMVLDWYLENWIGTTKYIDYAIDEVENVDGSSSRLLIRNDGGLSMPLDVLVTLEDGRTIGYYIPMLIMRGEKQPDHPADEWYILDDWPWTHPVYAMRLPFALQDIASIEIDPSMRMADVRPENNLYHAHPANEE